MSYEKNFLLSLAGDSKTVGCDASKPSCLVYETFNKCPDDKCEFAHGLRCPFCRENVLPIWNETLRNTHMKLCHVTFKLRKAKNYESTLSWLYSTSEDDRKKLMYRSKTMAPLIRTTTLSQVLEGE